MLAAGMAGASMSIFMAPPFVDPEVRTAEGKVAAGRSTGSHAPTKTSTNLRD